MNFETEYQKWLNMHMSRRRGERLRRLKECHGFGEKLLLQEVWWPVVGNFDWLHPEYEVVDDEGHFYYLDFAYLRFPRPTDLEADSYGSHARDIDRKEFGRGLRRQNAISLSKWNILRFSIDDLKEDPDYCRSVLRKMLEKLYEEDREAWSGLSLYKREIVRMASRSPDLVTVSDVCERLGVGDKLARKLLHELKEDGYLVAASGVRRISGYRINPNLVKWTRHQRY